MNKIKVYLASSWFTPRMVDILDSLENFLSLRKDIDLYSPRRDGIMLTPNQKHDTSVREMVFKDNIKHINEADLVIANIDSSDDYNDPGTMYEIGYAMSRSIPVIGFKLSDTNIKERFKGILPGFDYIVDSLTGLSSYLESYKRDHIKKNKKVLFVGAGNRDTDNKLVSYIIESGLSLRWVNEFHEEIYPRIDEIFEDVDFMIVVIDDRKTLSSWMIGQAYARGIPIVTYSDFSYGINVMLLISILTHIRGTEELNTFLQKVKREGIESIPKFDVSQLDSM